MSLFVQESDENDAAGEDANVIIEEEGKESVPVEANKDEKQKIYEVNWIFLF